MRAMTGVAAFRIVLLGQSLLLVGSGLTSFALSVWAYDLTRSATQFALVAAFSLLPGLVVAPVAGVLIDRWSPRSSMALSNTATLAGAVVLAMLAITHRLEVWHIYMVGTVVSVAKSFCWPAFNAALALLVPLEQLGRASGAIQLGDSAAQLVAPALGGMLLGLVGLKGVLLLEGLCALVALLSLTVSAVPQQPSVGRKSGLAALLCEAAEGRSFLTQHSGLLGLFALACVMEITVSFLEVLSAPIVLAVASSAVLGAVRSIAGVGMVAGSVTMSLWGGSSRRFMTLAVCQMLVGIHVVLMGMATQPWLMSLAGFGGLFFIPLVNGSSQMIWQLQVPPQMKGRVFSLTRYSALFRPLGYLVAGALADQVLEPLVRHAPSDSLISWIAGTGPGRGSALLLAAMGLATLVTAALALRSRPLREMDNTLVDWTAQHSGARRR